MKKLAIGIFVLAFASVAFAQTGAVILVSDITHVDMMIAKAAGEKEGVPVLVLENGMLDANIRAELSRLSVRTIILVGGPVVIKAEVQTELENAGYSVVRLWGAERTGTAVEVASYFWKGGSRCVTIADDTKDSDSDAETQAEAAQDAVTNECPFIPVPEGTMPIEVLDAIGNMKAVEARFVGRAISNEFRLKLSSLRTVEIVGSKNEVDDKLVDNARRLAMNESKKLKLVIVAAPNWRDILGFAGHAGRHTIVRIVANSSTVPRLIQFINNNNITDIFVVGNPALTGEISVQLEEAGIEVRQVSGERAAEVARKVLRETIEMWEERRRHAAGNETLIREKIKQYLINLLNRTELRLSLLETELASLNTTDVSPARIAEIQAKIDNAQSQISAIRANIEGGNFETARIRIAKILDGIHFLRWLHHVELKIDQIREVKREENNDETDTESYLSELERKLASLRNRCNADAIDSLIEKALTVRAELRQANADGDHIKAARLAVEMRDLVEHARHLSSVCERVSRISANLENTITHRIAIERKVNQTATVEITSEGFRPSTVTVIKGGTVTWINRDRARHWPASAIHPTHAAYPGSGIEKCGTDERIFDACKSVEPSESFSFNFEKIGKWNYHDHLNPSLFGSVIVVE